MEIIVRTIGERTEKKCIESCERFGNVHVIREVPFGEAIRKTYELGMTFKQEWIPVIDADVVLYPRVLQNAIAYLRTISIKTFCQDGVTQDKILMRRRRAGIHIYRRSLLEMALPFVKDTVVKPESGVRKKMSVLGYPTFTGSQFCFGMHDYDQYYRDLWRKSVCQAHKVGGMIGNSPARWKKLMITDLDYKVILYGHRYGKKLQREEIMIDVRRDYNAEENLKKLGIIEKDELI